MEDFYMKTNRSIFLLSTITITVVGMLALYGGDEAASSSSATPEAIKSDAHAGAGARPGVGPGRELAGSYIIDILAPDNAPDKTIYIKDPKGKISATWDSEHGHQVLTNVSFDGEVLSFNALSGTPGTEYFYFRLESYGDFLLGYAKTQEGSKSPVLAKAVK